MTWKYKRERVRERKKKYGAKWKLNSEKIFRLHGKKKIKEENKEEKSKMDNVNKGQNPSKFIKVLRGMNLSNESEKDLDSMLYQYTGENFFEDVKKVAFKELKFCMNDRYLTEIVHASMISSLGINEIVVCDSENREKLKRKRRDEYEKEKENKKKRRIICEKGHSYQESTKEEIDMFCPRCGDCIYSKK